MNKIKPIKTYCDIDKLKILLYEENYKKSGIYRWNNLISGKSYIGSSINLSNRFSIYCSKNAIKRRLLKGSSAIYYALLKYGYSNFSLDILEYTEPKLLLIKEQYYINILKPEYNILKIAGSRLGLKLSEKTKTAISVGLMGRKYTQETINKLRKRNSVISTNTLSKLTLRSSGVKVNIFDPSKNLWYKFPTMTKAAAFLNVKREFISKILDLNTGYKNYIFKFEIQDLRIKVFDFNNKYIETLNNIKETSIKYNIPKSTLRNYIKSGNLHKNKYYFRRIQDDNNI